MGAPLVVREDLSARVGLSKSALNEWDLCGWKAWHALHHRQPFIPNPAVTFGSCVDAGVENLLIAVRSGHPEAARPMDAAREVMERDGIDVDMDECELALTRFADDIIPTRDWSHARLQAHVHVPLEDWGEVDGHPDIVLPHYVWDVKTSKRRKETARSIELGLYALMVEEETGDPVEAVGYFTWVRVTKPWWQTLETDVTDDFRAWTRERVAGYVRAVRADELLNRRAAEPVNWSMTSGPKNGSLCSDCVYRLAALCPIAVEEEVPDA